MVFSNKREACSQIDIRIDGEPIQEVGKTKFLCVSTKKNLYLEKAYIVCIW